jgi:hypothetical protein
MKYKVGDRVRIKSQEWWDANKVEDKILGFEYVSCGTESFLEDMACYTGAIALIEAITPQKEYTINLDDGEFSWTDEMFEEGTW